MDNYNLKSIELMESLVKKKFELQMESNNNSRIEKSLQNSCERENQLFHEVNQIEAELFELMKKQHKTYYQ